MSSNVKTSCESNEDVSLPVSHMSAKSCRLLSNSGRNIAPAVPMRVGKRNEKSMYW